MKVYALFFLVVMAVLAFAYAAEETCTIEGKTIKKGASYLPPGKCQETKCIGKDSTTSLACPSESASPTCKYVPQDNSKTYPKCCPSYIC